MKMMKNIFIACLIFAGAVIAKAAEPVVINLWENMEAPESNELAPDQETMENPGWITYVSEPTLTVYPAENPNGTAVVMCPGGGYWGVAVIAEGHAMAEALNDEGVTLGVLKYRMPNGHARVPADDARRALQIMADSAAVWGINRAKLGIAGASAGGHLASTVATHPLDSCVNPAFQILIYPVISMKAGLTHADSRKNLLGQHPDGASVKEYSNETKVTPQTPPAFIAVSQDDDVVDIKNSLYYFNALTENGVPVSFHVYPTGGHGRINQPDYEHQEVWLQEMLHWLNGL